VQRHIEALGIPTIVVTLDTEQTALARPPRALHPRGFAFGHSLGKPGDKETQTAVIKAALEQLIQGKVEPGKIVEKEFPSY
jgi:hypothetical protein